MIASKASKGSKGINTPTSITAFPQNGLPNIKREFTNAGKKKPNLMKNEIHQEYETKYSKTISENLKQVLEQLKQFRKI